MSKTTDAIQKVKGKFGNLPGPGPGRPKGLLNQTTIDVRDMILQAVELEGGVEYLRRQSRLNPTAFMALLGKIIPLTVKGTGPNDAIMLDVREGARARALELMQKLITIEAERAKDD